MRFVSVLVAYVSVNAKKSLPLQRLLEEAFMHID